MKKKTKSAPIPCFSRKEQYGQALHFYLFVVFLVEITVLKVSYWDQSMSVVHRRREQFALNDNSYTIGPILTKLHRNDS